MKIRKIEISPKTIIFTVVFLLSLILLWQIRSIIILLFISFVLMQALNPLVTRLEKIKIPRVVSILLIYIILLTALSFAIAGIVPILVEQTNSLVKSLPDFISNSKINEFKILGESPINLSSQLKILENIPGGIAKTAVSVVSNVLSGVIILVLTFYLLLEKKNFPKYGQKFFGDQGQEKFLAIVDNLESRLGHWVLAEFFLMTIIGVLSYLGYMFLGLKYAVPLAILAGVLEAVPTIGPIIATVLAGLLGLTISPLTALLALIWGIIVQQLENNIIVPKIMKSTIGFNPLVTILLIAIGAQLAGVGGAILALPVFLTIESIFKIIFSKSLNKKS